MRALILFLTCVSIVLGLRTYFADPSPELNAASEVKKPNRPQGLTKRSLVQGAESSPSPEASALHIPAQSERVSAAGVAAPPAPSAMESADQLFKKGEYSISDYEGQRDKERALPDQELVDKYQDGRAPLNQTRTDWKNPDNEDSDDNPDAAAR